MCKTKTQNHILFCALFALCVGVFAHAQPGFAQAVGASGLPLPRFASLGSSKINVRLGPGQKYDVAWVFVQNGLPIEIIQEFDAWRKVRDSEGTEGWIHKSLLSGRRTALVTPWLALDREGIAIYARADATSPKRAILKPRVLVSIDRCENGWCEITGRFKPNPDKDKNQNFSGWAQQTSLWGVYQNETLD